ncbi:MAG: YqgE/AlgH family protein [Phenylobacterium sp.]
MDPAAYLSGQLLIALPAIGDPRFERAVALLFAHDAAHAMGLVLNKPVDGLKLGTVLEQLSIACPEARRSEAVFLGGPVQPERGFVIHTDDFSASDGATLTVPGGLACTPTREALDAISRDDGAPRRSRLALGYAGWGPGQLEDEIRRNVWLVCPADEEIVFDTPAPAVWAAALARLGIDPSFLTADAGQA